MTQELPLGQEDDEIQALAEIVAKNLAEGEDPQVLAQQLVDSGWDAEQATSFVGSIHQRVLQAQEASPVGGGGGSEAKGWLLWIGAIAGINLLSWLFNWGFWIY